MRRFQLWFSCRFATDDTDVVTLAQHGFNGFWMFLAFSSALYDISSFLSYVIVCVCARCVWIVFTKQLLYLSLFSFDLIHIRGWDGGMFVLVFDSDTLLIHVYCLVWCWYCKMLKYPKVSKSQKVCNSEAIESSKVGTVGSRGPSIVSALLALLFHKILHPENCAIWYFASCVETAILGQANGESKKLWDILSLLANRVK